MGKHVIVGAGQIGTQLADILLEQGHEVVVVTRSGSGPDAARRVAASAADRDTLTGVAEGADTLYNCVNPPYHRWLQDWPPLADAMLATAEATGAGYVILGNLYVYAPPTAPIRESDPLAPPSPKAEVRAGMWRDALAAHEAGRVRATEIRASDFYGPRCVQYSMLGERFIPPILAGRAVQYVGDPDQPHSWSYAPDVARSLAIAGTDDRSWGRAWHVPTAPPHTLREMAEKTSALAGVPNPGVRTVPRWVLRAAGLFSPMLGEFEAVRYQFVRPFVLDSSDFEATFGMAPTPVDDALAETLAWWRARERAAA